MTNQEFWQEYRKIHGEFSVDPWGALRHKSTRRCPGCEVAARVTGYDFDNSEIDDAAKRLKLDKSFIDVVVMYADDYEHMQPVAKEFFDACLAD